jgi:hypothetical protein
VLLQRRHVAPVRFVVLEAVLLVVRLGLGLPAEGREGAEELPPAPAVARAPAEGVAGQAAGPGVLCEEICGVGEALGEDLEGAGLGRERLGVLAGGGGVPVQPVVEEGCVRSLVSPGLCKKFTFRGEGLDSCVRDDIELKMAVQDASGCF